MNQNAAFISSDRLYRYWLTRGIVEGVGLLNHKVLVVCMLNPSTADENTNDPTIVAVMDFAKRWGYTYIIVINCYAYRATDPQQLWHTSDPIGEDNHRFIKSICADHPNVLVAWGANAPLDRQFEVAKSIKDAGAKMMCLGLTKNGSPRHPLYIKRTTQPQEFDIKFEGDRVRVICGPEVVNG